MSLENIGLADAALSNLIAQWLDQPAKYPDNARSGRIAPASTALRDASAG